MQGSVVCLKSSWRPIRCQALIGAESTTEVTLYILSLFLGASFQWEAGQEQVCVLGVGGGYLLARGQCLPEDKETGSESSPASSPLYKDTLETRRWLNERMHPCGGLQEGGRRGPELVFYGAPWSLEGSSYTLDLRADSHPSLFTLCHSNFWRRERTLDLVCLCVCV